MKKAPEEQTAGQEVVEHPVEVCIAVSREDEGQNGNGADEGNGDAPVDDLTDEQVCAADEQCKCTYLADGAGHEAEEHVEITIALSRQCRCPL